MPIAGGLLLVACSSASTPTLSASCSTADLELTLAQSGPRIVATVTHEPSAETAGSWETDPRGALVNVGVKVVRDTVAVAVLVPDHSDVAEIRFDPNDATGRVEPDQCAGFGVSALLYGFAAAEAPTVVTGSDSDGSELFAIPIDAETGGTTTWVIPGS